MRKKRKQSNFAAQCRPRPAPPGPLSVNFLRCPGPARRLGPAWCVVPSPSWPGSVCAGSFSPLHHLPELPPPPWCLQRVARAGRGGYTGGKPTASIAAKRVGSRSTPVDGQLSAPSNSLPSQVARWSAAWRSACSSTAKQRAVECSVSVLYYWWIYVHLACG